MDDKAIIEMFWGRDEQALILAKEKFDSLCRSIAINLLGNSTDAEECVNDTFLAAWQSIPPQRPNDLAAYLGKIARNISVSRLRSKTAAKRNSSFDLLLSELEECIPSADSVEKAVDAKELSEFLNNWLGQLSPDNRALFILRYWYGKSPEELSFRLHSSPAAVTQKLFRLRKQLKKALESEGVII